LESIAYLSGSRPAPRARSVTRYDSAAACNGLNLYVSGHGPEAHLIDMAGRRIHTWRYPAARIWPERDFGNLRRDQSATYWRRAYLLENGDLLAIFSGLGLLMLDRDSRLLWVYEDQVHHDLALAPDGRIYVLTRQLRPDPAGEIRQPLLLDYVAVLDTAGRELERVSILEAIERSPYVSIIKERARSGDILHTNSIVVLDDRLAHLGEAFRPGNVLLSILRLSTVCTLDLTARRLAWAHSALWKEQHDPTVLPNDRLLVFDNQGRRGASRVIEYDLARRQAVWSYPDREASPEALYSETCGTCQRLPNGNTLITESDAGRAIEIRRDGTIVWEFLNPHRAGQEDELVATLFAVHRYGMRRDLPWLRHSPPAAARPERARPDTSSFP
ncbi:MAG: hypothetical protein GF330_00435, partial [Candidatus Eisenbacteria bacterium]|nr:hypothetical protein [Candidatus Eisenbacteria bacterium]